MDLSLILCSRNDEYMGNSRWRLQTTLNGLGERLRVLGRVDVVEVIVADWGSDTPLSETIALEPSAAAIVSFLTIPPAIARAHQGDSPFPEVIALNAAARRARGRFIGRIDQDTIVGDRFLRWFFDGGPARDAGAGSEASTVWFANRRNVPFRLAARCPERAHVERFIRWCGRALRPARGNRWFDDQFWSGSVGIWLVPRDTWQACGGYDERLIYYNWMETDMVRRLLATHSLVDLGRVTGHDFYHLDHHDPAAREAFRAHDRKNPDIDRRSPPPLMCPNGPAWGLADCDLPVRHATPRPGRRHRPGLSVVRDAAGFIGLVAGAFAAMAGDWMVASITRARAVAGRRVGAASRGVAGQPIWLWPGTLWKLWHGRKVNRAR